MINKEEDFVMKFTLTFTEKEYNALNKVAEVFTDGEKEKFFGPDFVENYAVAVRYSEDTFCDMLDVIIDRKKGNQSYLQCCKGIC